MTVANDIALVMFDLDGTLVDTAPEICDAVNDTLRALGLPGVPLDRVKAWIGHGTGWLLVQALAEAGASGMLRDAQPRFAADYERRCGTSSRLYPHARDVLLSLGAHGVHRALVTNKEERFALPVLRRHGLRGLLDRVICGDTLPTKKPDPGGVLDCLRAFGVQPRRAVFVGDSSIDVTTARNANVPVWAVTHGYNMDEPIADSRPDRLIETLDPLRDITRATAQGA